MKKEVRRDALKIGIPFIVIMTLVTGMALPVLADSGPKSITGLRIVQGEVISIASDNLTSDNSTIVVQNGSRQQVSIKVDANTKYYVISVGNASEAVKNVTVKEKVVKNKTSNAELKQFNTTGPGESITTASCGTDPNWLGRNGKQAQFSDIQVGDRVIARVKTADNLATQVLIIKAPAIQRVKGTVTAVSDNSITITPSSGAAVTLSWDANTRFVLKGLIAVQNGQYASAVYNRKTMVIMTADVQATAPASGGASNN
jgi:hypothetical protein